MGGRREESRGLGIDGQQQPRIPSLDNEGAAACQMGSRDAPSPAITRPYTRIRKEHEPAADPYIQPAENARFRGFGFRVNHDSYCGL